MVRFTSPLIVTTAYVSSFLSPEPLHKCSICPDRPGPSQVLVLQNDTKTIPFSLPPPLTAFDGGDCCECTCENPFGFYWACDEYYNRFDCKDTSAPCYGEEYIAPIEADDDLMSYEFVSWEDEESLPTVDGAVEVGTKIEVGVSATAYDARPGVSNGESGCGDVGGDGCAPANSRDGISSDMESRWSCASYLVDGEGPCQIEYTFGEPQDIVDIQVAFWKENERTRTLEVSDSENRRGWRG